MPNPDQPPGQPSYGHPQWPKPQSPQPPAGWQQPPPLSAPGLTPPTNGTYQAAAIINWIVLGMIVVFTCGFGIIAAAWFIPMTINIQRGARDRHKHTALAVCTLLFCNIISGVLMLIEDGNRQPPPLPR